MTGWREIRDRRQALPLGRTKLWFDLGQPPLVSCVTAERTIAGELVQQIGDTLYAQLPWRQAPPVYGDAEPRS